MSADIPDHWTPLSAAIEAAVLRAWPALEQRTLEDWTLRFSEGYSKRSNCVLAGTGPESAAPVTPAALEARVLECERVYAGRGMPAIFKLHGGVPDGLDALLASRGYTVADRTLLMALDLDGPDGPVSEASENACRAQECDAWLAHWCRCSGADPAAHGTHRRILERIEPHVKFLCLESGDAGGGPAACGMAVADGPHLGIFDVVVDARLRRRGLGSALVRGLLAHGRGLGAGLAYLQVVRHNRAARALYDSLGFAPAGSYWYRVSPDSRQPNG